MEIVDIDKYVKPDRKVTVNGKECIIKGRLGVRDRLEASDFLIKGMDTNIPEHLDRLISILRKRFVSESPTVEELNELSDEQMGMLIDAIFKGYGRASIETSPADAKKKVTDPSQTK